MASRCRWLIQKSHSHPSFRASLSPVEAEREAIFRFDALLIASKGTDRAA